jgi:tetratricopeptide (TPR) repeat protein
METGAGTRYFANMRYAISLVILIALAARASAAAPVQQVAPQAQQQLDKLFTALPKAGSADNAKPIEAQIVTLFNQSGSPSVDLLMNRASAALAAEDSDTAGKLILSVTEIAPNFAEGWRRRGELAQSANDDVGAMKYLQRAIALNPREFQACSELAEILASYGDKPAALQYFRKALALDPWLDGIDKEVRQLSHDVEGDKI